jgi:hypothetical protein
MAVRRYLVGDRGLTCGAGRFEAGDTVFEPWLDGQGDRLVRLGVVSPAGSVEDDDPVLDTDLDVGDPHWLGAQITGEPEPVEETEPDTGDDDEDGEDGEPVDLAEVLAGTAAEVLVFAEDNPDQLSELIDAETAGKARSGLLKELTARLEAATAGDTGEDDDE